MEYRKGAHTVYNVEYHFVWITKYRYPVLRGEVGTRLRDLLRQTCMTSDIRILKGSVGPEHVHMLVSCPPSLAPAKIVQYLKGRSSRRMQEEFPQLKKRYWGRHIWARGYFVATVGQVTEEMIKQYIANQDHDTPDEDFKVEQE